MSDAATREAPAPGVVVWQPARGFRYAADAFWLAGFALEGGSARTAVDLGAGSGVVALLLAGRGLDVRGYDVRSEWSPLWERSLAESQVPGRVQLERRDIRDGVGGPYDLAVANPPYAAAGTGPVAPDPWKAAARTESGATLVDFVRIGLAAAPRLCLVLPIEREREALAISPARRRAHVGARRALLELAEGAVTPGAEVVTEAEAQRWYTLATGIARP